MSDTGDFATRIGIEASVSGVESVAGLSTGVASLSQQLINLSNAALKSFSVQEQLNAAMEKTRRSVGALASARIEEAKNTQLSIRATQEYTQQLNALSQAQSRVSAAGKMTPQLAAGFKTQSTYLNQAAGSAGALADALNNPNISQFGARMMKQGQAAQRSAYYMAAATMPLLLGLKSAFFSMIKLETETVRLKKLIGDAFAGSADAVDQTNKAVNDLSLQLDKITEKFGTSRVLIQSLAGDFAELGLPVGAISRLTEFTAAAEKLGNLDISSSQNFIQALYQNIVRVKREAAQGVGLKFDLTDPKLLAETLDEIQGQLAIFNLVENKTSLSLKDIADAFPEASAAATTFGLTATETAAMLVPMIAAGFQVGASANSIKVSLQRMVAVTKQNTVIMDQLNGSLDNFHVSAGIGMDAIQNLVDGFDALQAAKGAQGTLEFFSRLFGVRQGPRMLTSFMQMASFQKSMVTNGADEYRISKQLEQSVNARLTSTGHDAIQVKKIIDLTTLHRGAIEKVNGQYTERAKMIQQGQQDADKALKASFKASNNTADYLGQVSTETGRVYFMEAIGGVTGANAAMQQELNYSINTVTTKFNILRETMLGIGRSIVPIVGVFIDLLLPVVKKVKAFFDGLSLTTKKWIGLMLILPILIPQMKLLGAAVKIVTGGLAQMWTRSISGSTSTLRAIRGLKTELVSLEDLLNNPAITKGYNKLTQMDGTDKFLLQQDPNHAGYQKGFLNSKKMRPGSEGVSLPMQEVLRANGVVGATDKKSIKALMGKATKTGLPDTEALIHSMLTDMGAIPEKIADATAKATDKAATSTAEKLTKAMKGTIFQNNTFVGNKFGGGTSGPGGSGLGPRTPKAPTTGGTPTVPAPTVPTPTMPGSAIPTPTTPTAPAAPSRYLTDPRFDQASTRKISIPSAKDVGKAATISAPIAAGVKEVADEAKAELEALSKTVTKEVEKATEVVKEATKPKGKSPRGSPAKVKTAVEKTVGEAVSTATAPIESAVAAVTEASTETTKKVEKAVKEVKDKVKAPKSTAAKVKKAVEAVVTDTVTAVEGTVAGVAEASAGATAAVEKAAKSVGKATKVASSVTKAPTGQAAIVKLSYKEIAKFFDDAGQTIPAEYDFIRTTNKEVALTKKAKTDFFKNITKQFEKGSATPLGTLERSRGRQIYKLFGKEVNAQKDAYKSVVDELLTDRRSLEKAASVKAQIDSTKASMMVDRQGNAIIPKASGAGKAAEKRLIAEKKRAAEAITAMNAAEALKLDSLPGMAPPPGVEEVYTTRPKAEIAAIEKSLAEAKANLKIVEKEGTDVAKQLGATYRKQIDDLQDELLLARSAINEKIVPASRATSQLINTEARMMRDESPIQNLTSGRTASGKGIGPNNPVRYANEFSDSVGSMERVISPKGAVGPAVLNPDIRAKILHDLELEKLKQHLLQSTDENIIRDLKFHMSEVADEILDSETNLTGSGGNRKATAAELKKIKNAAAGRMADNMGVDLTKYLPTSDEFDPAAEAAILRNKKVVNGVTEFYKGIGHGGDELVAELASMKTDVSPANISARQKLAKAFMREKEAISPSGPGGRTVEPLRKVISGGMGKAKAGVVTVGKLIEDSINETVNALPASISDAKRQLIRATASAVAISQPGAAVGEALQGGLKLVDQELTASQAEVVKRRLELMRKQVLDLMSKDVAGFKTATITDSKGKITKFVSDAKSKAGVLLNKLAKGTALSVSDLGKAVEGVFVDSMGAASYAVTQVEKTKKGFRGFQFKDMATRVTETLNARVAAGTKAQASAANVGSGTAVGNRAAERAAAKEAQKLAQDASKKEAEQIVENIQAKRGEVVATEQVTAAEEKNAVVKEENTAAAIENTAATKTETAVTEKAVAATETSAVSTEVDAAATSAHTATVEASTAATGRSIALTNLMSRADALLVGAKSQQIALIDAQIAGLTAEQLSSKVGASLVAQRNEVSKKLATLETAKAKLIRAENATIENGLGAKNANLVKAKADFERAVKNASKEFDKLKTVAASSAKELASVASAAAPAAGTKTAAAGAKTAATGTKAAATAAGSGAVATGSKKVIVTAADAAKMSGASGIVKAIEKQTLQFDSSLANFFKGPNFFQGPNIFQGKIITADKLNLKIKDSGKAAKDSAKALTSEDPLVKQARGRRAYTELLKRQESKRGVPYSDAQKDRLARLVGFKKPTMPAAMAATKASDMKARVLANIAASKAATEAAKDAAKMGGLRSGISTGKAGGFAALSKPIPLFPGLAKMTAGVGGSFDKITKKISVLGEVGKKVTSLISDGFRSSSSLAGKAVETFAQKFVSRFLGMSKAGIDASSKMAKAMTYILSGTRVNIKEFERMNKVMKLLGRMDASVSKAMKNSAKEVSFVLRNIGTVVKTDLIGNFALLRTSLGNSKVLKIWSFLLFTGMTRGAGAVGLLIKGVKSLGTNAQRVEAVRLSLAKYSDLREARGLARTIPLFQRLIVAGSAYTGIGRGIKTVFSAATKTIFNMIGVAMKLNASLLLIAPVIILIAGLLVGLKSGLAGTKGSTDNLKEAWRAIKEAILALARPLMDLIGVFGGLGKATSNAGAVSNALNGITRAVKAAAQAFERFAKGAGVKYMKDVLVPIITRLVNRFIMLGRAIGGLFKNDSAAAAKNFTGLFLSLAWEAVNAIQKIFAVLAEILPAMGPILASMIEAVLNATIDAFMYIMNFGKEVALFFGVMLTTIGLALSVFTGGAFLPVAGFGAALIAAAGAASLLDKHIGSVKKKVKGFSNTLGKGIADGLGAAAGYIQKDMLGSIKDKISEKYGDEMGKDINTALSNTMKDPKDVKKAIEDALKGGVKDPTAANAAGEALGSAIAKGIKDKLIQLKEEFTGAFFGKADDQVSKIVDDYKTAIDKQKEEALKAFDTQVSAIEALGKAEEELTAKMEYEEKRREMIKERAMNKENYLRERKIAKYEGRTEDVRSLDLSFRKTDKASGKEITNLDTERAKTLQEQQRSIAIAVINREKDIMAQTFDEMQKQFDINLAKILNKSFSTKEEFDSLLKEIGGAAQGFSGDINKVFEDTMFALPSIIRKSTDPAVGMFSLTMDKLVEQAQMAFGATVTTGDTKSILGAAYAMANGLPDAFKQAFNDGIAAESVTPFVTKITTIMGGINVDTIWIEAGRSAIEAMIGEMKRKLRALRGDLYDEFKTLFAGMGADYNQLFPELEALAKQIAKIEAIRSQSGGGSGSTTKKPVAPGGGGMGDDKIDMKAYSDGTPDKIGYKTVPDKKGGGFFGGIMDGMKSLVDYLGPVKTAILGVVGVFAGFFALQGLFSVIASAFETMMIIAMYAIQPIGTAAAGISATVAAVVAAIAVVIGVIIYMYIKFKWFRDMVNDTFKSVIDFFVTGFNMLKAPVMGFLGAVWDGVKQIFDSLFGPIIDFGKKIIAGILIAIGGVVAAIVGVLRGISIALDFIKAPLFKIIGWVINLATGIVNVLADIISGAIDFVYKIIGALFSVGIGGPIKLIIGAFKIAFDIIVGIVKIAIDLIIKAFDFLKGGLSGPFEVGFGIIKGIFDKIKDIVSGVIDFIKGIFGGFSFGDISGPITAPFKIAFDFIKDVFGKIFDVVKGVFENIVSFLQPIGETILKILIAPFKILFDVFKAIANNPIVVFFARVVAGLAIFAAIITTWGVKFVFEKLWDIINDVIKILHDLISVVWDKVSGAFNKVKDVVIGVWNKIHDKVSQFVDWFHEEFGSLWNLVLVPFAAIYEGMKWLWKYIKTHLGPIIQELWQNFKDGVDAVWGKITDFANWISSIFGGLWNGIKDIVSKVWAEIKDAVDIVWNKLLDFALWLNNIFEAAWDRIGPIVSAIWNALKESINTVWNALKDFGSWLSGVFHKIWDGIGPMLSKVWDGLKFAVSYVWDKLKAFGSWLSDVFGGAWSKISDVISKIWDGLKSAVDKVWESLKAFGSWVKDIFGGIWNKIGPILSQMWENFKNNTKFAWEQLKSFGSWLKDVFGKAWGFISDAIGDVWDKVSPIFGWIRDKISGAASAVWDVLKPAFDALRDVLKAFWEISEPIFDGFWGILEIIGRIIDIAIIKPLQRLWDLIVAGWHLVEPIFNKMWDWLGPKIGAVIDYAKEAFKLFWGAIKDNWNDIKDIFSGVYTWLKDKIGWVINNLKELWDKFVQKIKDTWNNIVEIFQKIGDKISNAIGKAIDGITGAWDWFTTKMGEVWIKVKDIATNIGNWFKDKIGGAIDFISGLISAIPSTFKAAVNMVIGAWNDMWKWMDKFAFPGKIFGISLPGWIANKSISDFIGLPTIPLLKYNGGKIGTYMMGGMAYGSGGMTNGPVQQGIPAILHGGEYVLNHKAVARIGTDALDRLNNYKLSKPNLPSMPSVPRINMPGVGSNNPQYAQLGTNSTQNVNIYVDNFIGEPEWFNTMMKTYNTTVLPRNQKTAGLESRVINSYNGLNRGL